MPSGDRADERSCTGSSTGTDGGAFASASASADGCADTSTDECADSGGLAAATGSTDLAFVSGKALDMLFSGHADHGGHDRCSVAASVNAFKAEQHLTVAH